MKLLLAMTLALFLFVHFTAGDARAQSNKPNIIFIMADDMGDIARSVAFAL